VKVKQRVICDYCHRDAKLVTGVAIYPHRPDLLHLWFWHCAHCAAYVGCHKAGCNGSDGTMPLGRLATAELRRAKNRAHEALDPVWQSGLLKRKQAYAALARELGISQQNCHIGMFDLRQCLAVPAAITRIRESLQAPA
jgi:hypothetical protein